MPRETLAKELEEKFLELEHVFEKIDPDRIVRRAWASLAHALEIEVEDVEESKAGAFFKSLVRGLTRRREPEAGKDLRPLELVKDLVLAFLKGPVDIVASDAATEVAEALVVHKASKGKDLDPDDLRALQRGIENLHGSALYPLGYEFIYHAFDELAAGRPTAPKDGLPIYPPSEGLFEITERMIELRSRLTPLEDLIQKGTGDPGLCRDPGYQAELRRAVESSAPYRDFRSASKDLTLAVIGRAATDFLIKAIESIPQVEPYLQQVTADVERDSAAADRDYVEMLIEAPSYVRVLCYVSEANDGGHHIQHARIPFPPATSEAVRDEFDGMLSRLFGARADGNPFHSTRRARFFTSHPLKVEQQYEAWRSARGLPPPREPSGSGHGDRTAR